MASDIPMMRLACSTDTVDMASILPRASDERDMGETRALFMNPYRRSQRVFTPPNMLVKMAVSTITPAAMNSMYSPSKPAACMSGFVPAKVFPTTMIQTAGCISRISTPLLDLRYLFISRQNMA